MHRASTHCLQWCIKYINGPVKLPLDWPLPTTPLQCELYGFNCSDCSECSKRYCTDHSNTSIGCPCSILTKYALHSTFLSTKKQHATLHTASLLRYFLFTSFSNRNCPMIISAFATHFQEGRGLLRSQCCRDSLLYWA